MQMSSDTNPKILLKLKNKETKKKKPGTQSQFSNQESTNLSQGSILLMGFLLWPPFWNLLRYFNSVK